MQQYIFKVFPQVFQDTFDCKNNIKDLKLVQWDIIEVIVPSTCGGLVSTRAPHPQERVYKDIMILEHVTKLAMSQMSYFRMGSNNFS